MQVRNDNTGNSNELARDKNRDETLGGFRCGLVCFLVRCLKVFVVSSEDQAIAEGPLFLM